MGDRKENTDKLNKLKTENQDSDRQIKTAKTFTSKKDKVHKEMRDTANKVDDNVDGQNRQLEKLSLAIQ